MNETMIPYYGNHISKQYIQGKPIRYGFKVHLYSILDIIFTHDRLVEFIFTPGILWSRTHLYSGYI